MLLTEELKECTRAAHQATEKKMLEVLKQLRSKMDYIHMLYWLYGFYSPVEELIGRQDLPAFLAEKRSHALLRDIMDSGFPLQQKEQCDPLPLIDSFARALGALYVLEGSALGGRVIAGMIRRQIGITENLSFFEGDQAATDVKWQSLKDYLKLPRFQDHRREILAAAQDTFITFKKWIDKNELQPQL